MELNLKSTDSLPRESGQRPGQTPLHILTLTPFFPSRENEVGGCFVKEPLDVLAKLGVASSVIAVSPIYNPRHPIPEAPAHWLRYPQIPGTIGLPTAGLFLYARLMRTVADLHKKRPIDVIHAHAALPGGHAASLLARRLRLPYFVTVHGLDVFNTCFLEGAPALWRRRVSIKVYEDANTVVCVSHRVQQILNDGMPGAVRGAVVYNGTDCDLFSPESPPSGSAASDHRNNSSPEILVVGNLIAGKGQHLVLRAVHRLASSFPQLRCHVIGEGPERASLEALARELGIGERVRFAGRQSRLAVASAMRNCTVFALPSRSEGLGCVYLEAMACSMPVIACREQGIEELIEHQKNGWLISPDSLDELSHGLEALLRSPDRALQIGASARQTILNGLTLAHQAHNLATLYRQAAVLHAQDRAL